MLNYEIILYWSQEDVVFVAEVPELPGCMATAIRRKRRWPTSKRQCNCGWTPRESSATRFLSLEAGA